MKLTHPFPSSVAYFLCETCVSRLLVTVLCSLFLFSTNRARKWEREDWEDSTQGEGKKEKPANQETAETIKMSGSHPRLHQSAAPAPNALSADKDAEMPATEKDLAEDAPWKKIQQNTFTRWCNEHLKCVNKRIGNLQTDLSDGLRLIGLLEVLSQKKMFRKYNQRPTFRQMQLENVSVALEFLDKENIKLVSIGGSDKCVWVPGRVIDPALLQQASGNVCCS